MSPIEPEGPPGPSTPRRRRSVRLRTLLIWLAVVPIAAMSTQVAVTAQRLLAQSQHLRADVAAAERFGAPLYTLMVDIQAERALTAARWAGTAGAEEELRVRRQATDRAGTDFRGLTAGAAQSFGEVNRRLDGLAEYRRRADARSGGADGTLGYYTGVVEAIIQVYQQEFSHAEDLELAQVSRPVVPMLSATEMVAREDALLALAGPSRELNDAAYDQFVKAVGAHRYLHETWIAPYLSERDRRFYERITASRDWQTKIRIENAIVSDHTDTESGIRLPAEVGGWRSAYENVSVQTATLNVDRAREVLTRGEAEAAQLQTEVAWLIGSSGAGLLVVVAIVVLTTRSVLRRLRGLHERTVAIAEKTLPDVVARLQRGQSVDADALPAVRGGRDEVSRIDDAFARVVAVSVDGHRQLAAERHGFGMFAAGIASRTGNLVSRQLNLTEDIQDTFGHDEALLAQLMRSDQLTVGMRRQIENLLILAGGEVPDPHTEPMRVADLLREAAAEVEDFRRIERQALDEISVEPHAISQISHLLAELLDNAARFSPPRSKVVIRAELVADGLSVEIEDRGPRVTPASYEEMNARLHSAPPYSVLAQNAHRLGLFVVGHLADQLEAAVTLRRSVYGGTSAVVILPQELLVATVREPEREPLPSEPPAPRPSDARAPELVLHTSAGLPARPMPDGPRERPAPPAAPQAGTTTRDTGARPALPERVPHTHIAEQLRAPRAEQGVAAQDTATPEEVADAWADYERGTQTVEEELRQDQR
ncbi:nitrate- and nitrite sensing domain-containing protein [Streptomyces sp. NBC_00091]|uniref:nitrate- and nitrite sensing domain-containing protein n=1 Tax=Streptomyces sp. NBC_00091 TaxID=2975648 RepID=UPI002259F2FA|nr:nitrate- and nitrite sensing domain-containing protein [Streptomyces sp. NBC_00091]MCX5375207.1 nitrate- and nitrite sensing domain-containing protein [Streptomyces sp. NBC_00091]